MIEVRPRGRREVHAVGTGGQRNGHFRSTGGPVPAVERPPSFKRMWVAIVLSAVIAIVCAVALSATLFASTGPRGPVGLTGATGKTGAIGARGPRGARGSAGLAGATGARGASGMTVLVPTTASGLSLVGTDCGRGIFAGANASCAFARNVRAAWTRTPGQTNSVNAYSPTSKRWYTMSCGPNGVANITCVGKGNSGPILVLW